MGRRNVERAVLSCLKCRTDISGSKILQATYLPFRLSHTSSQDGNLTQNPEEKSAKKVKIGNKIYILETTEAELPKEKSDILTKKSSLSGVTNSSPGVTAQDIASASSSEKSKGIRSKGQNSKSGSSADLKLSLAAYSKEQLEFAEILRQPLVKSSKEKPFLGKNETLTFVKNSANDNPFVVTSVKEILRATQTITDQVRFQLRNEVNLRKLGPDGFSDHVKDSKQHARDFETLLLEYMRTGNDTLSVVSPVIEAYWESLKPILKDISEPLCFKKNAIHPHLRYKANIDYVGSYKSTPCLIKFQMASWKNSIDDKIFLESRLNLLACLGALNFDPSWSHQISSGVLIRAYSDGTPADAVLNNVKGSYYHWKVWLRMVEQFWRKHDKQFENKEERSGLELKKESVGIEMDSRLVPDDFVSAIQFNQKITNETDPTTPYESSIIDESVLPKLNCKMHLSDSAEVPDSKEKSLCPETIEKSISRVNDPETTSLATDQTDKNDANFVKPATVNSFQDCNSHEKHEQAATPSEDVEKLKQRPHTRATSLLDSFRNFWKS